MKIWLLRPVDGLAKNDNPWEPWFEKAFGFVVRADSEAEARLLAHAEGGDENRGEFLFGKTSETTQPWMDVKYSTCVELTAEGASEVVLVDFRQA